MNQMVSSPDQVAANITRFANELAVSPELQATLGYVHAWYALWSANHWIFGPSKFVAYADNTAERFVGTFRKTPDGGRPEMLLRGWFGEVDLNGRLGRELKEALKGFLNPWNREPRRRVRISVVLGKPGHTSPAQLSESLTQRISVDPEVAGGRPCIRGTRMRVSDIVDMLAAGASKSEVLADYPYLTAEDIAAALAYAARATDHRVIVAA